METLTELYMRYKELGGKYVTLGSDAHVTKAIGANFAAAEKMAADCGLKIVYYKRRQRHLCEAE